MQLAPLELLVSQCNTLTRRLEALDAKCPRASNPQPLFSISGLQTDLQRVIAIEMVLTRLEEVTSVIPAEVFDAVNDVLELIGLTYAYRSRNRLTFVNRRATVRHQQQGGNS